jgi:hypothetical protein
MTLPNLAAIISIVWDLYQMWKEFRAYRQKRSEPSVMPDDSQLSEDKSLDNK